MDKRHRLRIPKRIKLPFNYEISIEVLPHEAWLAQYKATFNDEVHDADDAFCVSTVAGMTIYLDSRKPMRYLRAVLLHEVGHCVLDWQARILSIPSVAAHLDLRRKTDNNQAT